MLTKSESLALAEFIDTALIDTIRSDMEINNLDWLVELMSAYKKLCDQSGYNKFGTDDSDKKETLEEEMNSYW